MVKIGFTVNNRFSLTATQSAPRSDGIGADALEIVFLLFFSNF
jgi:hypothetical protein